MANRYLNLFKLPERLYAKGSPIIIETGALHKDLVLNDIVAQLKFRSIVANKVSSVTVDITCYNASNEVITSSFVYKYEDIAVNENEHFFGNKTLITLPNNDTRSFDVKITQAEFSDGTCVMISEDDWKSLPKQIAVSNYENIFINYFTKKYGSSANFLPTEYDDLWFCTCGQENRNDKAVCSRCGIAHSVLFPFDIEQEKKNAIYEFAKEEIINCHYESAVKLLKSISGWKDADEQIVTCQKKIEEIKAKEEAERLERERKAEIERKEAERIDKRNKKIAIITTSIICAVLAFIIVLNAVIIPNGKYNDAVALMNAGKYAEAIAAFEELDGYKDSTIQINNCNTAIMDGKYNDAVALSDAGKYIEAISAFEALNGYKDSAEQIKKCNIGLYGEEYVNTNIGDYITFGAYEQDNNISNSKEEIEWLVLDKQEGKVLVISKYSLDCQRYNTSEPDVTWETCSLRKWLNGTFINNAFSAEEQAMIPTVTVSADKYSEYYSTNTGNATQDKVFLLSITEANQYFASDEERKCAPTDYAIAQGTWTNDSYKVGGRATCWWWLRTPGRDETKYQRIASVDSYGGVYWPGYACDSDDAAVRPALWIDLNS